MGDIELAEPNVDLLKDYLQTRFAISEKEIKYIKNATKVPRQKWTTFLGTSCVKFAVENGFTQMKNRFREGRKTESLDRLQFCRIISLFKKPLSFLFWKYYFNSNL